MSEENNEGTEKEEKKAGDPLIISNDNIYPYGSINPFLLQNSIFSNSIYGIYGNSINSRSYTYGLSTESNDKIDKLKTEIQEKENKIKILLAENKNITEKNQDIERNYSDIRKGQELLNLTSKIHPQAANVLLKDNNELLNNFNADSESNNVIMAIDIRRSTDLMLNAKNSDEFAIFITGLCEGLKQIVLNNFGVFDKFTGDGILAYYPEFYSGKDAINMCCLTALKCHAFFSSYYKETRNKFKIILNTGLGIGIDYGKAKLVRINNEPTIVGVPVVYACRLSNAPSNHTYINQPVYELLEMKNVKIVENDTDIKTLGDVIVYDLIDFNKNNIVPPEWYDANQAI